MLVFRNVSILLQYFSRSSLFGERGAAFELVPWLSRAVSSGTKSPDRQHYARPEATQFRSPSRRSARLQPGVRAPN